MEYPIEELLVLVKGLADRYTGKASTSITYEAAQQLMGAVLYCIRENEIGIPYGETEKAEVSKKNTYSTAREAYEAGYGLVTAKVRKANEIFTDIIMDFKDYGNIAYHDTVVKGIPEFFKWYDPELNPQDHIILMDYMVLDNLQELQGVNVIYRYLNCIRLEQKFLKQFPEEYVREVLISSDPDYEERFINPCGVLLRRLLVSLLIGVKTGKARLDRADYEKLSCIMKAVDQEQLSDKLTQLLKLLVTNLYQGDRELYRYLENVIPDFTAELINGAENNTLDNVI